MDIIIRYWDPAKMKVKVSGPENFRSCFLLRPFQEQPETLKQSKLVQVSVNGPEALIDSPVYRG